MTREENATVQLALGRIFRMASRPTQPGDVAEYERCRGVILDILDPVAPKLADGTVIHWQSAPDERPNWARDRNKGAQGD